MVPATNSTTHHSRNSTAQAYALTTLQADRHHALVRAAGELGLRRRPRRVSAAPLPGRPAVGPLDVSHVRFLDCSCLGALVAAHDRQPTVGGRLVITGATPRVMRMLRLTNLDDTLFTTPVSHPMATQRG